MAVFAFEGCLKSLQLSGHCVLLCPLTWTLTWGTESNKRWARCEPTFWKSSNVAWSKIAPEKKFQFYNNINLYVSTTDVSRKYTLKILDKWNVCYTGAERSLQIPEDLGSNPVTGNFYWAFIYCLLYYRKVTGNSPFLKHYSNRPKQAQIKQFENIFSYRIYFTE